MDTPKLLLWSSKPAQLQEPCAAGCCITSWRARWLGMVEVRTTNVQEKFHHCPMTSMKTTLELKCTLKRNYLRTTNLTLSKFDAIEPKALCSDDVLEFWQKSRWFFKNIRIFENSVGVYFTLTFWIWGRCLKGVEPRSSSSRNQWKRYCAADFVHF